MINTILNFHQNSNHGNQLSSSEPSTFVRSLENKYYYITLLVKFGYGRKLDD